VNAVGHRSCLMKVFLALNMRSVTRENKTNKKKKKQDEDESPTSI
jgi:hypothetical protein